jgi:hypothetical protein
MTGGNGFDICDLADYFEMHALILSISVIYCWHNDLNEAQGQPTLKNLNGYSLSPRFSC